MVLEGGGALREGVWKAAVRGVAVGVAVEMQRLAHPQIQLASVVAFLRW